MLRTENLLLIPATAEMVRSEQRNHQLLADMLNARVPDDWPPESLADALPWFEEQLHRYPEAVGWYGWYALLFPADGSALVLAGSAGFKGAPDEKGQVEIGYSVLPRYQRRGLATQMVRALTAWAFSQPGVGGIIAQTAPDNPASVRVLLKNGFKPCEGGEKLDLLLFRLERAMGQ